MLRTFIHYSVFVLFFLVQPAFAQDEIGVRTGEHKDYSRLVFDWDTPVDYTVDTSKSGMLLIRFKSKASVSNEAALKAKMRNFSGAVVLSEDPLTVALNISKDSRTRNFFAGNRLVLDVYNSPSAAVSAKAPVEPKVAPKPPKLEAPAEAPKEPAPIRLAVEKLEEKSAESKIDEVVEVEKPKTFARDKFSDGVQTPPQESLKTPTQGLKIKKPADKADNGLSNLIAFTSTKSFGLSVFEVNNSIWLVNDQSELALKPRVSGPDQAHFTPLESMDIERGTAFRTKALKGAHLRGEGGGLLWRVIISRGAAKGEPIAPLREGVNKNRARSGYVVFPFKTAQNILDVLDPVSGSTIKVISVDNPKDFTGSALDFVDFKTLPSAIGLAIVPKVDDLDIQITAKGVEISRPGGLSLSTQPEVVAGLARKEKWDNKKKASVSSAPRAPDIFDFKNWELGGIDALDENINVMLSGLNERPEGKRLEDIIILAKMHLSNGLAPEALGFLNLAQNLLPGIEENPEFRALSAAANALISKSESAFLDLSRADLKQYGDVGYWRAYTLADLGDWQQAEKVLPEDLGPLQDYPKYIYNRVATVLAEIALRSGNVKGAEELLARLEEQEDDLWEPQKAALSYLKGEAERQKGNTDETKKLWGELITGKDELYRARAGLALTRLEMETKEIAPQKAIDNLERLRYAWRGDELEAQINYWLGKTYFDHGEYGRGLNILREAASYAVGTPFSRRITSEMGDIFADLFLSDKLAKVSPVDATALYEQFTELVPTGKQGDQVVEKLAERLVQADLLNRASDLLEHQIKHRLTGSEAHRVSVRLSAIMLINNKPAEAIGMLKKSTQFLQGLPEESQTPARYRELSLLRARALSRQGRPDQALALLNDLETNPDVNRLKADIAWNAGYWDDAGEALDDVILDKNMSMTRPLDDEGKTIILQRAVALNLSGDRIALANIREQYSDLMAQTDKAKVFEVITRARQSAALADRQTLMNVAAETDLFADFLNSYRSQPAASN